MSWGRWPTASPIPQPVFIERVFRNVGGAAVWCDVIQSAAVESCTDIARMALDDALLPLTETLWAEHRKLALGRCASGDA